MALPVVYVFRSSFGALVYALGCALWIATKNGWRSDVQGQMFFWLFLAAILPFYLGICRRGRRGWAFGVLTSAIFVACIPGMGMTAELAQLQFGSIGFAGLFVLFYLFGIIAIREHETPLNALTVLGAIAVAATAIVLSFGDVWPTHGGLWKELSAEQKLAAAVCISLPVASIALAIWLVVARQIEYSVAIAFLPVAAIFGRWMTGDSADLKSAALLMNLYTVVLGAELMVRGIRAGSITRTNFGLLVIVALACTRFFDSDLSFVARGLGFISVGAVFLLVNLAFFRRRPTA